MLEGMRKVFIIHLPAPPLNPPTTSPHGRDNVFRFPINKSQHRWTFFPYPAPLVIRFSAGLYPKVDRVRDVVHNVLDDLLVEPLVQCSQPAVDALDRGSNISEGIAASVQGCVLMEIGENFAREALLVWMVRCNSLMVWISETEVHLPALALFGSRALIAVGSLIFGLHCFYNVMRGSSTK